MELSFLEKPPAVRHSRTSEHFTEHEGSLQRDPPNMGRYHPAVVYLNYTTHAEELGRNGAEANTIHFVTSRLLSK
jgi:hypothetical protein